MAAEPPSFPLPHLYEPGDPTLHHNPTVSEVPGNGSATLDRDHEHIWQELTRFYADNEQTIRRAASVDVTSITNPAELNLAIDSFTETINVILDGLVVLGNVHPVLGVAIFAFHSVISLDLTRRDNDKKVAAVKLQMQNMMCTMFQLRKLRHVHVEGTEKEQQRAQLQELVKAIAHDITECGSDLNYFMDRKLISKLIKAKIYERRFADHIEIFIRRRAELQSIITSYIAAGIDAANLAIADVGHRIENMSDKLDSIALAVFRKIDTPRERDVLLFIEAHGGARNCVAREELLSQLLSKTEEVPEEGGTDSIPRSEWLPRMRDALVMELNEDLKAELAKNQARFEKLLTVQNNNLERISGQMEEHGRKMLDHNMKLDTLVTTSLLILEEGKIIKKAIVPNATVKLKDPELEQIWNRMGLKRSVKAKHFVLTFRDHLLTDRSAPNTPLPHPRDLPSDSSLLLLNATDAQAINHRNADAEESAWVLKYLDVAYVRPLVEAIDEDGSGFISVKEANKFALSKPMGWSLLQWIAYWAAGWHISLSDYKDKIYSVLQQMLEAIAVIHPANRVFADYYFNSILVRRVEALARSVKSVPDATSKDSKLSDIAKSMASLKEDRLLANLKEVSFVIKSASDVRLIAGSSRVETWILPLIYLLMTRHLEILKLGQKVVLHSQEFSTQYDSLLWIFIIFDERLSHLEAIFRQMYRDVEAQFDTHSYGMFLTSFKKEWSPGHNMLLKYNQATIQDTESKEEKVAPLKSPDVSILSQGKGPVLEFQRLEPTAPPAGYIPHPVEGAWVGACARTEYPYRAYQGPFAVSIGPVTDGKVNGKGENFCDIAEYAGRIRSSDASLDTYTLLIRISWPSSHLEHYDHLLCKGRYDAETQTIRGSWIAAEKSSDPDKTKLASFPFSDEGADKEAEELIDEVEVEGSVSDLTCGRFLMVRNQAADVFRFRHLLDTSTDSSLNLARRQWGFAISTVLFQTQRRIGSSSFWRARLDERKKWIELSMRDFYNNTKLPTARGYLSDEESEEFIRLRLFMHPTISRVTEEISCYLYDRIAYDRFGDFRCDVCNQRIAFIRFLCITCMEEDFSNQIDMCAECIDSSVFNRPNRYIHHPTHTLMRVTRRFHYCQTATIIPEARTRSDRIKASFKAIETQGQEGDRKDPEKKKVMRTRSEADKIVKSKPSLTPLVCACCGEVVSLPCWACAICVPDTLICLDCHSKDKIVPKRDGASSSHLRHHPLLRISDSDEVKTNDPKPGHLDIYLSSMEGTINEGLAQLEHKMSMQNENLERKMEAQKKELQDLNRRNTEVQDRLEKLETRVEQQLGAMTALLQELLDAMKSSRGGPVSFKPAD